MKLKCEQEELLSKLKNQIAGLEQATDIHLVKRILNDTEYQLSFIEGDATREFKKMTIYQENEFSATSTEKSVLQARDNAIRFLNRIISELQNNSQVINQVNTVFSEETAITIVRMVLNNFYCHIEAMYEADVHGKGEITKEKLDAIKIGNEYDVQRILYSLIKPIFPEARLEVCDDTGYGTIRYDIVIEKYNVVVEVKCSRESMTEKKLIEEINSDAFSYKYSNIFFFIYDKQKVIKNKTAFIDKYTKKYDNKKIEAIIIQPILL